VRPLVLLVVPCAVAFFLAVGASRIAGGPVPQPVYPHLKTVVWADRVFVDRTEFARWLRSRGASYGVWQVRHPERVARVAAAPPDPRERRQLPAALLLVPAVVVAALLLLALARALGGRRAAFRPVVRAPRLTWPLELSAGRRDRDVQRPRGYVLQRRADVAWILAASSAGIVVALLLPHI